jgi:hypothetical protein
MWHRDMAAGADDLPAAGHADLGKESPQSTVLCDPPDGESALRAL